MLKDQRNERSATGGLAATASRVYAWVYDHRVLTLDAVGAAAVIALSAWSAVLVKDAHHAPALMSIEPRATPRVAATPETAPLAAHIPGLGTLSMTNTRPIRTAVSGIAATEFETTNLEDGTTVEVLSREPVDTIVADASIRWFNNRPVRPKEVLTMKVTAYSPDAISCGVWADGQTATLHHVTTNGGNLVAADPRLLPYGTLLTVPGYDDGRIVPVLDCGGAIKGNRLDLLYPTHRAARQWGVKVLPVTVWEYADGLAPSDPRAER